MKKRDSRLGLPRWVRLRATREFQALQRSARRQQDDFFSLQTQPNLLGFARLGITVSRRVSPRAVDRNRIKRRIRESFRRKRTGFGSIDIVVVARPTVRNAEPSRLEESLDRHWKSIQAQCKKS